MNGDTVIVVPCYNEAARLNLRCFDAFLAGCDVVSLLAVDDGSTDDTPRVLEQLRARHPRRVSVLGLGTNVGKAEAVRRGMKLALRRAPAMVGYWDADLATPLEAILQFRSVLVERPELALVMGSRVALLGRQIRRRWTRHLLGRAFATAASLALGLTVYDTQCGAKLFRVTRETAALFDRPFRARWIFDVEILARMIAICRLRPSASGGRIDLRIPTRSLAGRAGLATPTARLPGRGFGPGRDPLAVSPPARRANDDDARRGTTGPTRRGLTRQLFMDAKLYDELWRVEESHWWFQARRQIVWSLVHRYVGGAAERRRRLRICELGCGTGGNLAAFAGRHDVIGVDSSPHALEYARRKLGNRVRPGSLPDGVDLPAESFDVVLLTDVLEHVEEDARSAQAAMRLLRPAGIVVATVPAYQWLYSPRDAQHHHFRRYSRRQFRRLWTAGNAEIALLSHYNTLLFPPAAAVRLASKFLRRGDGDDGDRPGDLKIPPRLINRLLANAMASESNLLGRVPMPFGLSLVAVVRKRLSTGLLSAAA